VDSAQWPVDSENALEQFIYRKLKEIRAR